MRHPLLRWLGVAALVIVTAAASSWVRRKAMAPPGSRVPGRPVPARGIATFTLPAPVTREPATRESPRLEIAVPAATATIELRLGGAPVGRSARAAIRTLDGRLAWTGEAEPDAGGLLGVIRLPAQNLPPGDYSATVTRATAPEAIVRYRFRVLAR